MVLVIITFFFSIFISFMPLFVISEAAGFYFIQGEFALRPCAYRKLRNSIFFSAFSFY